MNELKMLLMLIALFGTVKLNGQHIVYPVSVPHLTHGMFDPEFAGPFAFSSNPSTMPFLKSTSAGVYIEKRYMATELMLIRASFAAARNGNGFGLSVQHFGSSAFNENAVSLGYGKSLGRINVGLHFGYFRMAARGYKSNSLLQYGIGASWKMSDKVYAAISMNNPNISYRKKLNSAAKIPSSFRLLIGFHISAGFHAGFETEKEEGRPIQLVGAIRYSFSDRYYARASWTYGSNQAFIHLGWKTRVFRFETGLRYHQFIGLTPSFLTIYQLPTN